MLTSVTDFIKDEIREHGFKLARISLVAITAGVLVWQAFGLWLPTPPGSPVKSASKPVDYQVDTIKAANLFGPAPDSDSLASSLNLPETTLQLTLRGVFTAPVQTKASAIIESANQDSDYYRVNASLPGGARLLEVHAD